MTMVTLVEYLRKAAARHPNKPMPKYRRLEGLARDGAAWAELQNGRWRVIDEAAADQALGLNTEEKLAA
jgi:hypothetical protein